MKILIFCATKEIPRKFYEANRANNGKPALPVFGCSYEMDAQERARVIARFRDAPDHAVLVADKSLSIGWRAPEGTLIAFDQSWPYDLGSPETIQAAARAVPDQWED